MLINASVFWYYETMTRRGFTTIELIITVAIMGILLVLAFVNLTASQARARDEERKTDVESTSQHLESFYKGRDGDAQIGRYPSTLLTGQGDGFIRSILPNIDIKSMIAPGASSTDESFIPATNSSQSTSGVAPQPTVSQYVYQPLQANGALCTLGNQECRRFNIYYRLESDGVVYMVTSKNQ